MIRLRLGVSWSPFGCVYGGMLVFSLCLCAIIFNRNNNQCVIIETIIYLVD